MSKYSNSICSESEYSILINKIQNCIKVIDDNYDSNNENIKELLNQMNNITYNFDNHYKSLINKKLYKNYKNQLPLIDYNDYKLFNLFNRNTTYEHINKFNTSLGDRGHKKVITDDSKRSLIGEKDLNNIYREILDYDFKSSPPLECQNVIKDYEDLIEIVYTKLRNEVRNTNFKDILNKLESKISKFIIKIGNKQSYSFNNIVYRELLFVFLIKEFNFLKEYGIIDFSKLLQTVSLENLSVSKLDDECCWWKINKSKNILKNNTNLEIKTGDGEKLYELLSNFNYDNHEFIDIFLKEKKGVNIYMKYLNQDFSNKYVFHKFSNEYTNNNLILEILKYDGINNKLENLISDTSNIYYKIKEHEKLERFPNFNKLSNIKDNNIFSSNRNFKEINDKFNNLLKMNGNKKDFNIEVNKIKGSLEDNLNNLFDFNFSTSEKSVKKLTKMDAFEKKVYKVEDSDIDTFGIFYSKKLLKEKKLSELIVIYQNLFDSIIDKTKYTDDNKFRNDIINKILSYKKKFSLFNYEFRKDNTKSENCNMDIIKKRFYLDVICIDLFLFRNVKLCLNLISTTIDLLTSIFKMETILKPIIPNIFEIDESNILDIFSNFILGKKSDIVKLKEKKSVMEKILKKTEDANNTIFNLKEMINSNNSKINAATNFNELYTNINESKEKIKEDMELNIIIKINLLKNFFE